MKHSIKKFIINWVRFWTPGRTVVALFFLSPLMLPLVMYNLVVPNITDMSFLSRFEIDMLSVTKSGYATGVEIKISASDLKNDLKKPHIKNLDTSFIHGKTPLEFYYSNLKYFYYCVPDFLKDKALEQIPEFAGLYIAKTHPESYQPNRIHIKCVKQARMLFNKKWTDEMIMSILRLGTMRILNLKEKINDQTRSYNN